VLPQDAGIMDIWLIYQNDDENTATFR